MNGRIIRDKIINHALRQAWQHFFPEGKFPVYAIYLEIPFDTVDINVHPTKHEVRFENARFIHDFIVQTIQEVLSSQDAVDKNGVQEEIYAQDNTLLTDIVERKPAQDFSRNIPPVNTYIPFAVEQEKITATHNFYHNLLEKNTAYAKESTPQYAITNNSSLTQPTHPTTDFTTQDFSQEIHVQSFFDEYIILFIKTTLYVLDLNQGLTQAITELLTGKKARETKILQKPLVISLNEKSSCFLEELIAIVQPYEVSMSRLNTHQGIIRSLPELLTYLDWEKLLHTISHKSVALSEHSLLQLLPQHLNIPTLISEIEHLLLQLSSYFSLLEKNACLKKVDKKLLSQLW